MNLIGNKTIRQEEKMRLITVPLFWKRNEKYPCRWNKRDYIKAKVLRNCFIKSANLFLKESGKLQRTPIFNGGCIFLVSVSVKVGLNYF
jgi:hypothetical protein